MHGASVVVPFLISPPICLHSWSRSVPPIRPVFGDVIYQPANHYNTLQLGYFHANYQLGMDLCSQESLVSKASGLRTLENTTTSFVPFNLPDGNQFSVDDLKINDFYQVVPKIRDPHQHFFALLGWAGCVVFAAKYAGDEGRSLYQKARNGLSCIHHVDFGGIEAAITILREIDAINPVVLADNIIRRQRINV